MTTHKDIRNDDDYDDWEYGTEPLPGEPWTRKDKDDEGCQDRTDLNRIMSSGHSPDC